eukprot:UN05941
MELINKEKKECMKVFCGNLDDFIRRKFFTRYVDLGLVPNIKELSESLAAFTACRDHLSDIVRLDDPTGTCVVIGDGKTPRTGMLLTFFTKWQIHSVDPIMRIDKKYDVQT